MIRKSNLSIILIFVLVILNIFLMGMVYKSRNVPNEDLHQGMDILNENYQNLFQKELLECLDQNTALNDSINLRDKKGKLISIKDLLPKSKRYKLVVRVSQENCFTCYSNAFKIINSYTEKHRNIRTIYIGSYNEIAAMTTFIRSNLGMNSSGFNLETKLNLGVEKLNQPYLFILDEKNHVHNVFVINKQNQPQVGPYMSSILKKYF